MRLEVDPNGLTTSGEELHVGAEHLDRPEAAMKEDERLSFTRHLVPELDPINSGLRIHWARIVTPSSFALPQLHPLG